MPIVSDDNATCRRAHYILEVFPRCLRPPSLATVGTANSRALFAPSLERVEAIAKGSPLLQPKRGTAGPASSGRPRASTSPGGQGVSPNRQRGLQIMHPAQQGKFQYTCLHCHPDWTSTCSTTVDHLPAMYWLKIAHHCHLSAQYRAGRTNFPMETSR